MAQRSDDNVADKLRLAIRAKLATLPNDVASATSTISDIRRLFYEEIAAAFSPRINAHIQSQPQQTHEEKQKLASWVNHELRELGLAIRSPETGNPAILVTDYRHSSEFGSKFRLQSRGSDGRHVRSLSSSTVPQLQLMEDTRKRVEPFSKWSSKFKPNDSDRER